MRFPNFLMFGYGDGILPNGNAHIVGFGKDEKGVFVPEKHPERVLRAFENLHLMAVRRTIFHNWATDPWSRGGLGLVAAGVYERVIECTAKPPWKHFFASGGWAHGWRASIDGALEQGTIAAQEITNKLRVKKLNSAPTKL